VEPALTASTAPPHVTEARTLRHPLIDRVDLELSGDPADVARLLPILPLWSPRARRRDRSVIRLRVEEGPLAAPGSHVFTHERVELTRDDAGRLVAATAGVTALIDGLSVLLRHEPSAPAGALESAFDIIWPLVLPSLGYVHVHSAALRDPRGNGWLLAGDANIGKSTSTLALAAEGWSYASDDASYVVTSAERVIAHGWAEPLRLSARSAAALRVDREDAPDDVKAAARLAGDVAARRVESVAVDRLLFPELGSETALRSVSAAEALGRLVRASAWIMCLPARAAQYLQTLTAVAERPAAVLTLGPELMMQPALLAEHLLREGRGSA
jgi:hypothetical protein